MCVSYDYSKEAVSNLGTPLPLGKRFMSYDLHNFWSLEHNEIGTQIAFFIYKYSRTFLTGKDCSE